VPSSDLMIERFGKYEMEYSSSSGIVVLSTTIEVPASTVATHTTGSLRLAIVTSLAANPTALAAVALMTQSDQQPGATPLLPDPPTAASRSLTGMLRLITSPHNKSLVSPLFKRVKITRRLRDRGSRVHRLGWKIRGRVG